MKRGWLLLLAGTALTIGACAGPPEGEPSPAALGDPATESPSEWSGTTLHVPRDYPTIQSAVDAAAPGDLVLIQRGTYREEVQVTTQPPPSRAVMSVSSSNWFPLALTRVSPPTFCPLAL